MVLVDITWRYPIWTAVENWRRQGGKVAFVIYDILPITHSEFVTPNFTRMFTEWFDKVCRNADLLLAISGTVRDQLRSLFGFNGDFRPQGSPQIESFRLGAELDMWRSDAYVRPPVRTAFEPSSGPPPYLMVGTLEPRKNHLTVLDAFDHLWERGSDVRLVVVGRLGWKFDAVEQRLLTHPRFGRDLYWFPDLSDTELGHCYRHAKATIFASWVEGYGLPIVEGLQHGLPVIASDLPVHREVAGNFAAYFDAASPEALAACIEQLETRGELPGVLLAKDFRPVTWYEATEDLLRRCRDFTRSQPDYGRPAIER
jgi:alpha-1,2-rhamnosyltransferase